MRFFDKAKIFISSGRGGNGCLSFRREKFIPRGGPDGGNGGKGGDIIIKTNHNLNTLFFFHKNTKQIAEDGESGKSKDRHGKNGKDLILEVPVGTQFFDENEENLLLDLDKDGMEVKFAKGGKGGLGNTFFKNSVDRAPRKITRGELGESGNFIMKLKLVADVGLLGMPNAGKSSLINILTNVKSDVAPYAFTTKRPILGVLKESSIVICDIPGLIEGASSGSGLGLEFLQHVERSRVILHVVDISDPNFLINYRMVKNETFSFSEKISEKLQLIILNKIDLVSKDYLKDALKIIKKEEKKMDIFAISTITNEGIVDLKKKIIEIFKSTEA